MIEKYQFGYRYQNEPAVLGIQSLTKVLGSSAA